MRTKAPILNAQTGNPDWTQRVTALTKGGTGGAKKLMCRSPQCGKDFLTSLCTNVNMLCEVCWSVESKKLMTMSSATGAKKKTTKRKNNVKNSSVLKKKTKTQGTPEAPKTKTHRVSKKKPKYKVGVIDV